MKFGPFALSSSILSLALGAIALAQTYRGEVIPIAPRAAPIEFVSLRFLTFAFGREGPMDAPLQTQPVTGREYFVEANLSGVESALSVRFELIDINGHALQTVTMWSASDGITDGEFHGFVTVPDQPFRAVVTGDTTEGTPIRSVLGTLFRPAPDGPPDQVLLPAGIPENQSPQIQEIMDAYRKRVQTRAVQAFSEHPGGLITFKRPVVSRLSYEPLTSATGTPIGMRLRYSIRFLTTQTITATPHVFPEYPEPAWRGLVVMKALTGTISPMPRMEGVQSPQDVIVFRARALYQAGLTYTFTIDMVPDFVFEGTESGRFCVHDQKFTNRTVWNALIASKADVRYSVTIADTGTSANIPYFYPQRTFYESFTAGGAFDCGPTPNIQF